MRTEVRDQPPAPGGLRPGGRADVRGSFLVLVIVLVIAIGHSAHAQTITITLKTGQKVETLGVRRDGEMVMGKIQVGAGSGEVGYQVSQIANVEFPEPRGLKAAADLMAQRQPEKALAEIEPVVAYYASFKEVPGAFWSQAALIKVSILAALQRDAPADALAAEIQKTVTDPDIARAVQVRLTANLNRKKNFDKAIEICDAAIRQATDPAILADAWVNKGDALAGKKEWDEALLAYLHVPIFYSDERTFIPAAMLGSARAYWRLDDAARARKTFNDLIAAYPKSGEAAIAQSELQKIQTP
jgi:tetratricopeptide (TPR) repeat protein